ncbi:MAG: ATP-dependent DNA helicase RecG [Candidatus Brocadiales bacterium]
MAVVRTTTTTQNPVYGPLQYLKGVGPWRAQVLGKLELHTIRDLLYHLPRDYQDRSTIKKISQLAFNETTTIKGQVKGVRVMPGWGRRRRWGGGGILEVLVADDTGTIAATWFNMAFLKNKFKIGDEVLLFGRIHERGHLQIINPEFDILSSRGGGDGKHEHKAEHKHNNKRGEADEIHEARAAEPSLSSKGGIVPIYPLTEGIKQHYLRQLIRRALDDYGPHLEEILPEGLIKSRELVPIRRAMEDAHSPESMDALEPARRRFAYEEIFLFQAALAIRRQKIHTEPGNAFRIGEKIDAHIRGRFPFRLTAAQERVVKEIREDMEGPAPMNRLLQGDVGSGKTVVALYALLAAVANGYQAALMVPTEVLAGQHSRTVDKYLSESKVRTLLLVGGSSQKQRKENLSKIKAGEVDLVIGTHALVSKDVEFKRLGMVVVDEQHKFGVLQRAYLRHKGTRPDVLVMTATPIPRSLSLTLFGDLDISIIDQLPPGRTPVQTEWVTKKMEGQTYGLIREELKKGRQVFVVYPLVEESEKLDLKSATEGAGTFRREFPEFKTGLLHGRLKQDVKDVIMNDFRQKEIDILVSTIVIEVGIDIPNATVMVIEHAERFGLAQLHQLRGRVGRSGERSYCLLFADPKSADSRSRLQTIVNCGDGFRIAEEDLRIRGPGAFFGTRQHGMPDYRVADLTRDVALLKTARDDAFKMVENDPALSKYPLLKKTVLDRYTSRIILSHVV